MGKTFPDKVRQWSVSCFFLTAMCVSCGVQPAENTTSPSPTPVSAGSALPSSITGIADSDRPFLHARSEDEILGGLIGAFGPFESLRDGPVTVYYKKGRGKKLDKPIGSDAGSAVFANVFVGDIPFDVRWFRPTDQYDRDLGIHYGIRSSEDEYGTTSFEFEPWIVVNGEDMYVTDLFMDQPVLRKYRMDGDRITEIRQTLYPVSITSSLAAEIAVYQEEALNTVVETVPAGAKIAIVGFAGIPAPNPGYIPDSYPINHYSELRLFILTPSGIVGWVPLTRLERDASSDSSADSSIDMEAFRYRFDISVFDRDLPFHP
jgi:hypothetical protein